MTERHATPFPPPSSAVPGTAASAAVDEDADAAAAETGQSSSANASVVAIFPDGTTVALDANEDPREVFADWLITSQNPWFAKSVVNRVWTWLMGRGIIHQPDDIRDDNPPCHPELKALLQARRKPQETLEELYLTVLSRRPSAEEVARALPSGKGVRLSRNDWIDLTWALLNNTEFLYRH